MDSKRPFSTPVAVLIGSVIIALAVVFGPLIRSTLSDRAEPAAPPGTAVTPNPARREDMSAPARAPASTRAPASAEAVTAEATKALERYRKEIVDRCWKPAIDRQPDPPTTTITFNFTFDADGRQLGRGAREDRATSRAELRECMDTILNEVTINPPGAVVQVLVPFTLP